MGFGKSEKQVREVEASDNADYDVEVLGSKHAVVTDEVFGAITEKGPNYRSVRPCKATLTTRSGGSARPSS